MVFCVVDPCGPVHEHKQSNEKGFALERKFLHDLNQRYLLASESVRVTLEGVLNNSVQEESKR